MKRALILGLGIGNLYKDIYENMGWSVVTVDKDSSKNPTYNNIAEVAGRFTVAHVCTPNFLHEVHAEVCARLSDVVFVEKPGLKTAEDWQRLLDRHPNVRIMMVKNNMWRNNIDPVAHNSNIIINWLNENRVPSPGTWFTTKELAWGGVSRDLMPHLLSIFVMMLPNDYKKAELIKKFSNQTWQLKDLLNTDYGTVDPNGVYDVDDVAQLVFAHKNVEYILTANWRTRNIDDRSIRYVKGGWEQGKINLGLCPEEAYAAMIEDALANIKNDDWWQRQKEIDLWIHNMVEKLS